MKLTIDCRILRILLEGDSTSVEIAAEIERSVRIVNSHLQNMKRYGWVTHNGMVAARTTEIRRARPKFWTLVEMPAQYLP